MTSRRIAAVSGFVFTIVACFALAEHRPRRIVPNLPTGITGRTLRDSTAGCGECHTPASYGGSTPTVTITGPTTLNAGATGAFTIKTVQATADGGTLTGIDVASSNSAGLTTSDANSQLSGNEITHKAPPGAKTLSEASATGYPFSYQMPAGLLAGTARTLYGASAVGKLFGWNFSTNFNVIVTMGSSGPSGALVTSTTASSIKLSWSGGAAAAYQINYQTGSYPANESQGYKKIVNGVTSAEITGLSPTTTYYFVIRGVSEATAGTSSTRLYSSNNFQITGTTQAVPPNTHPLLRTGSMGTARFGHTATLLPTGKVLIAGGQDTSNFFQTAELYDPATGTFTSTGSMSVTRSGHTATPLLNGKVLIAGGNAASTVAELYDPYSGTFSQTAGAMSAALVGHTATLLANGKVLLAGGTATVSFAQLFDPAAGTFSATGNMTTVRFNHTATLLTNGKVLLAGGSVTSGGTALATAELYDPSGNSFAATTNSLNNARKYHTATALTAPSAGSVRLVGGYDTAGVPLNSTETYDTTTNSFTNQTTGPFATAKQTATLLPDGVLMIAGGRASNGNALDTLSCDTSTLILSEPRASHTATVMANGRVLIAGGSDSSGNPLSSAEVYETNLDVGYYPFTVAGNFYSTGNMNVPRNQHTATLLPNGKVLIAGGGSTTNVGGDGCSYEYDTAELYDGGSFTLTGSMHKPRTQHTATLLANGKVLVAGGYWSCFSEHIKAAELYDPSAGTFTTTGDMNVRRMQHTATLLANGKVLIAGGFATNGAVATAELYDPNTGTFTNTGSMTTPRFNHSATLLPNGKVFIAGGYNDNTATTLYSAELYDPATGLFTASNSTVYYQTARHSHTATLLPNGKLLVADGRVDANMAYSSMYSSLLYDPSTDDYGLTGCCQSQSNGGRINATATLLPDGRVILIGGYNESGRIATAEAYDPAFDTSYQVYDHFSNIGTLNTARAYHTATLLPSGEILVAGGVGATSDNLNSAEVFRLSRTPSGFGVTQPAITSAPSATYLPATMAFTGTSFRLDGEASGGGSANSATDVPILRLQRVDNDQIVFVRPSSRDATTFNSTVQSGLSDGYYRASIVTNGVPSVQQLIAVRTVALVAPGSFSATASSSTSVGLTWTSVTGAATYEILRSEDAVNYASRGTTAGTAFSDSAQANKAYLYKVRAVDALSSIGPDSALDLATTVIFADDPLVAQTTSVKAVHVTALRTAVNAVRALAGLSASTFTDSTITAQSTQVKAVHVTELRSALNAARSTLGLSALSYTDPSLAAGVAVKAAHVTDLRNGVK